MSLNVAPRDTPRTIDAGEFDKLMQACGVWNDKPRFAIALSGGPDSIALACLLDAWVKQRGGELFAFTVDHQLRAESAAEAKQVAAWCSAKNIPHEIFVWVKESAPISALHIQARQARYDLLVAACKKYQVDDLFLAHHADDQAETVLMRMLKGSGIDGLAAMPSTRSMQGIRLHRPLLPITKEHIVATCHAHNWHYVTDPSNQSDQYLRGRLRNLAQPLAAEGLTTNALYDIARSAGMARSALEIEANTWLGIHAATNLFGAIEVDADKWRMLHDELKSRTLIRVLLCQSGEAYPPRNTSLHALIDKFQQQKNVTQTLSGCRIQCDANKIIITRELDAIAPHVLFRGDMMWDKRFKIISRDYVSDKNVTLRPVGPISRDALEKKGYAQVAALPAYVRSTLPAFYADDELVEVPEFMHENTASASTQASVKAIFLPERMLILKPFQVAPPLRL